MTSDVAALIFSRHLLELSLARLIVTWRDRHHHSRKQSRGMRNMFKRWMAILSFIVVLLPAQLFASVFGTVKAIVHDPQHRPVKGAQITVQSRSSAFKQTGTTGDDGVATIVNVPVGEYDIQVVA